MMRNFLFWTVLFFLSLFSQVKAQEDFVYDDHGLRDPFLPLVSQGGGMISYDPNISVSEMTLEGIVGDIKKRVAVINGNLVEEGKKIGAYVILRIEPDKVVLFRDEKEFTLRLRMEE